MKKLLLVPALIVVLFVVGCTADKIITLENTNMKAAFAKCVKALKANSYAITYADKDAGIINAKGSYDVMFGVTPQASLNLIQDGKNVDVHVKVFTDKENSVFNGDGTADNILNSIAPPVEATAEAQ